MNRECVTHHHACDCREAKFSDMATRLEAADALLRDMRNGAFNIEGWADAIDEYFNDQTGNTEAK